MSSFVMDKKQFIKAAGLCAGLADCQNVFGPVLRLWNYSESRVYLPEDYYKAFVWLYRLNAISVQKQYNDIEIDNDPEDYKELFNEYKAKAKRRYMSGSAGDRETLINAIWTFKNFVDCLLYQVEDPECETKIKGFVYRLEHMLLGILQKLYGIKQDHGWECDIDL